MRRHKRSLLLALILCCVSAVALAGIYKREKEQEGQWDQLVELSEADESEVPSEEEVSALVKATTEKRENTDETTNGVVENDKTIENRQSDNNIKVIDSDEISTHNKELEEDFKEADDVMAQIAPAQLAFDENTILTWPLQGEVLMEYSMDKTVYFATLQQYKYNPGMLIQGEEGTMVYAGATGVVEKIEQSDELGLTVTIDLGNSYTVTYGQLKALNVEEGSGVSDGSLIGLVAAPTKYYSVEGDHVYMELKKDGQPIDPLEFLD